MADFERKTSDDYYVDLNRIPALRAPQMRVTVGSERDLEYQRERTLTYLSEMVGHLLERIEKLEAEKDDR
ncbi:hypothetical protein [Rathayibacter sp. PhB152]|uniref:hypothetical protein n=1 Tax=Rathayibacter sp. PhB152 TaxID=2485190 RepID=UPI0011CE90B5|nr:hypothetical protein [Rathayibacter sp. PhB152]